MDIGTEELEITEGAEHTVAQSVEEGDQQDTRCR